MKRFIIVAAMLALTSCSTSTEALEKNQNAARTEKAFSENYQEVYRRLSDTAKRCQSGAGAAAFTVDAQLYNELGYGEISMSMVSALYPRNYYWKAKVAKTGSGSKVSVVSGNTLAQSSMANLVIRWAEGGTSCT